MRRPLSCRVAGVTSCVYVLQVTRPPKMVLRRLLFSLLNNPQLIEKLSESRPIRRAAQITAFAITKAQLTGRDAAQRMLRSSTVQELKREVSGAPRDLGEVGRKVGRIKDTFVKELKTGMEEVQQVHGRHVCVREDDSVMV
ncbi:protein NCBP2AS2-like [Dendropsophus ebraccatus]|uniref:protein NCBP2AS2-like n=1 Tax=Dendropsophus ebraccatus TaxID=150705 RepID=UPI00383180E3